MPIRTYKVRGSARDSYGGFSTIYLDVRAFTAADALVQIKLEHENFFPHSVEPVEVEMPDKSEETG